MGRKLGSKDLKPRKRKLEPIPGLNRYQAYRVRHAEELKEKRQANDLRRFYGITVEEYNARLEAQGGVCAICGSPPGVRRLAVDHDHHTGAIRGLLCSGTCNPALGYLRDSPKLLRRAAEYLEASREVKAA